MNSPCTYPQYCSTRAELVIIHTMAPLPTVIRIRVIGVDLPAFLLSKNVVFRVHRNAPGSLELVWRDLSSQLDGLAFQHNLRDVFLSGLVKQTLKPEKRLPKIKNPASSAGHSHFSVAVAPREARQISNPYS